MTVAVDHESEAIAPQDLEGLKGPVHALEEISAPREQMPSNWI